MKNALQFFVAISLFFCLSEPAIAHQGYTPFVVINDQYGIHNPITDATPGSLEIEHELASEKYQVLQPVYFRIDTLKLQKPTDWIKQAKFTIDFGDGEKEAGVIQSKHIYQSIGTFKVSIYAQVDDELPQLLTTLKIDVIPLRNYQLPAPAIKINDQVIDDQQTKLQIPFDNPIRLNAISSKQSSSKILEYTWDLGDGNTSSDIQLEHAFGKDHLNSLVVLRVKDENGFIKDSHVQLINQARMERPQSEIKKGKLNPSAPIVAASVLTVLLIGGAMWKLKTK